MPTENRSSNTEQMVSVPLDLVELALAHLPSDSAAGFELRDLLTQPAAQHQVEPIGEVVGRKFDRHWMPKIKWTEEFNPEKTPVGTLLYPHPPASDGFSAGDMADQGAKGLAARDGEVERLRGLLENQRQDRKRHTTQAVKHIDEIVALRAQLAERDALLREARRCVVEGAAPEAGGPTQREAQVILGKIDAALSACAESASTHDGFSAEQMAVQGADGYRNGIRAAAELAEAYPDLAQAIRALPLP